VQGETSLSGETADLSTGGVLLTTAHPGPFAMGDILTVSISIPWKYRRVFPFSRLVGSCQVVRIEAFSDVGRPKRWSLALEFCGNRPTMLGAIVT
jgi:hypothetical protein